MELSTIEIILGVEIYGRLANRGSVRSGTRSRVMGPNGDQRTNRKYTHINMYNRDPYKEILEVIERLFAHEEGCKP